MTISDEYRQQVLDEHAKQPRWGLTGPKYAGRDIEHLLERREYIQTVLDFGAGKGLLGQYIKASGWKGKWVDYDPGIPGIDVLPECQFDLVVTTDVLEHIEPDRVLEVIETLGKLTFKALYSNIACVPTNKFFTEGPFMGQDLHLSIHAPSWWRSRVRDNSGLHEHYYRHEEYPQRGRATTRCLMIHERS